MKGAATICGPAGKTLAERLTEYTAGQARILFWSRFRKIKQSRISSAMTIGSYPDVYKRHFHETDGVSSIMDDVT